MLANNFHFPYPVLTAYSDDVQPPLDKHNVIVGYIEKDDSNCYILPVKLVMTNSGLLSYIQDGKVEFVIEVDCPSTHYRRCLKGRSEKFEIKLPSKEVAGKVNFQPYLIAKEDFEYYNEGFHEDYDNESFDIELGDVLAIFNPFSYDFSINYSELRAYSSIMTVRKAQSESVKEIRYIADEDKIVVELPIEKYDQYLQFKNDPNFIPIIHASIVQNALLAVLLQEDWSQNTDDLLWKRTIRYRVEHEEGLKKYKDFSDKENLIMLSHKLLGDPIQRMFDTITLCTNSDDD